MAIDYDSNLFLNINDLRDELQKYTNLNTTKLLEEIPFLKYNILNFFLKYPGETGYRYCHDENYNSIGTQRTVYRYIRELEYEQFLENLGENKQEIIKRQNQKNPYKLSLSGLFCIILNTVDSSFFSYVIKNALQNYKEYSLLEFFLYPVIREDTINDICYDFVFASRVLEYLKKVCNDIVHVQKWLNNYVKKTPSSDGYFMNHVFYWNTVTKDNDNKAVKMKVEFFLRDMLQWENTDQLKINVKNYENLIEIYDMANPLRNSTLSIPEYGEKAVLRQNGKKIYEFEVVKQQGFLSIEAKTNKKPIDKILFPFLERHNEYLVDFLTQLRSRPIKSTSSYENSTSETLSKDENFKIALRWLDKELDLKRN